MKQMVDSGSCTIDNLSPLTVADYMASRNLLSDAGGAANLELILGELPNPETNITAVCNRLREKQAERKLIGRTSRVIERREKNVTDVSRQDMIDELLAASRQYEELTKTIRGTEQTLGELVQSSTGGLRSLLRESEGNRLPCPFPSLTRQFNGFQRGNLIVFGARPGMGKTSFAIQLATSANKEGVLFASYEMTVKELLGRAVCQVLETASSNIDDLLGYDEIPNQDVLDEILSGDHIWLDTETLRTRRVSELRSLIRKLKSSGKKLAYVICDHLQLMNAEPSVIMRKGSNRVSELSQITGELKQLAKDENVCVIALSQLSRPQDKRGGTMKFRLAPT
ncbi:MAG: hypothetical protein HC888_03215 [Candidatus Competibacteraceae bacterium]|nr:hypothetical protein [Candidatus Competibacteraceae bacterium]